MYNKVIEILNKAVVKDIRVYEMSSITPFYDYSIIASVSTARQGNAAVNYLKKDAEKAGLRPACHLRVLFHRLRQPGPPAGGP